MDRRRVPVLDPPCSRQGLPPPHVAVSRCALLPHSFHLFRFTPVVSFLWHFPYNYLRSPLATVVALCCPDFPLVTRLFETHHQRPFSDLALLFYHFSKNFSRILPNPFSCAAHFHPKSDSPERQHSCYIPCERGETSPCQT